MNKKLSKITTVLVLTVMIIAIISNVLFVNAAVVGGTTLEVDQTVGNNMGTIGNKVLGIIRVVGTLIAVGALMVIGIKYMMGSADEKAEYKKVMIPYIIGAILLFAAVNVAGWIANFAGTIQ